MTVVCILHSVLALVSGTPRDLAEVGCASGQA